MEELSRLEANRRQFLKAGAGAGIAASTGLGIVTSIDEAQARMRWSFDEFHAPPESRRWRILDAHDTGHVTSSWRRRRPGQNRRIRLVDAPDGREGFCHVVRKREIVHPLGIDSRRIRTDFSRFTRVLLRYHHWIERHSHIDGKWVGLQLGRGWVGRGHVHGPRDGYGSDGASATAMHPERAGGNGIRLLATHTRQRKAYGDLGGRGLYVLPRHRWMTVDIVMDKHRGSRIYIDGREAGRVDSGKPVKRWNDCDAIWYRNRLMHGGTPERLPARHFYKEWFGGFFVGVS